MDETDIAVYRYNGLNMRLMWQDDADADSTLESSERFYVAHDERWRPIATFRDTDSTPKEAFAWHAAGPGGFGGSSYIDSIILRDRDNYTDSTPNGMTSASDGTLEERRYFCQNWRADVVAVTKSDGTPLEYVRYSSYGEPAVYPVADLNMDGVVNSSDVTEWSNLVYGSPSSAVYANSDLDWDGLDDWNSGGADGDLFAESYNANTGLSGVGRVSSLGIGNRKGYAAYEWDQVIRANHVRYRVYFPEIGRWGRRDPIGYIEGASVYQYCQSAASRHVDPFGLGIDNDYEEALDCRNKYGLYTCIRLYFLKEHALKRTLEEFPGERLVDSRADAWRHCYWSCLMTQRYGFDMAKEIGDTHERGNMAPDNLMDLHNNAIGRSCGRSKNDCAKACHEALQQGRLITSPGTKTGTSTPVDYYYYEYHWYLSQGACAVKG